MCVSVAVKVAVRLSGTTDAVGGTHSGAQLRRTPAFVSTALRQSPTACDDGDDNDHEDQNCHDDENL
jgi:hypothetical protein